MSTPGSEDGILTLRYGEDRSDPSDAAVPIDVIGEDFHEVSSAPRVLEHGVPARLPLKPGSYLVRAFLPSGEVVTRQARVAPGRATVVSILPAERSPRESLAWAYMLKSVSHVGRAARSSAGSTAVGPTSGSSAVEVLPAPGDERSGIKMILWSHAVSPRGPWLLAGTLALDDSVARIDPSALAEASVPLPAGPSWLEVRGPGLPTRFVALAPNGSGRTQVLVVADDRPEPAFDPVDVLVSLGDRRAEATLSYLSMGSLDQARRLGDPLVDRAEEMLAQKGIGPITAAVAGYHLLKASALDGPHEWTRDLAEGFPWLPDGPVIRAWHLLRRPDPDPAEIRNLLVEAAARGLPLFTLGLRLLYDGLSLFARSEPDDSPAVRALESIRPYAAAANWSALMTTFYGDAPDRPELPAGATSMGRDGRAGRPVRITHSPQAVGVAPGDPDPPDELIHVLQCLDQMVPSRHRRMLESIFKHGKTPEAAGSELGIQSDAEMQFLAAMRGLNELVTT
jgi:hypothetical protein